MVLSMNVPIGKQEKIMSLWGVTQVQQYEKYLALPPMIGRSKSQAFLEIKHKVW